MKHQVYGWINDALCAMRIRKHSAPVSEARCGHDKKWTPEAYAVEPSDLRMLRPEPQAASPARNTEGDSHVSDD